MHFYFYSINKQSIQSVSIWSNKPIPNSEKERQLSNKVMAFAVDFGIPNQQIFESIGIPF